MKGPVGVPCPCVFSEILLFFYTFVDLFFFKTPNTFICFEDRAHLGFLKATLIRLPLQPVISSRNHMAHHGFSTSDDVLCCLDLPVFTHSPQHWVEILQ